jgi:hypothetical protein
MDDHMKNSKNSPIYQFRLLTAAIIIICPLPPMEGYGG